MRPLLINHRRSGERLVGLLLTLLMLLVPLLSVAQTTSLPLVAGQQLERDQQYNSPDGSHFLIFQGDGNLVVARTADKGFVWGLNTVGGIEFQRAAKVGMDASGHLYANEDDDAVVWLTPNEGAREGSTLNLTDSGELRIVAPDGSITWSSADATRTITEKPLSTITNGTSLERNVHYISESGQHYLVFQGDGNLVVARKADNGYVWGLNSSFKDFYTITMVHFSNGKLSAINENTNKHSTAGMPFDHTTRWQTMERPDYANSARLPR